MAYCSAQTVFFYRKTALIPSSLLLPEISTTDMKIDFNSDAKGANALDF